MSAQSELNRALRALSERWSLDLHLVSMPPAYGVADSLNRVLLTASSATALVDALTAFEAGLAYGRMLPR